MQYWSVKNNGDLNGIVITDIMRKNWSKNQNVGYEMER